MQMGSREGLSEVATFDQRPAKVMEGAMGHELGKQI